MMNTPNQNPVASPAKAADPILPTPSTSNVSPLLTPAKDEVKAPLSQPAKAQ